ncbi:DUF4864 domain-containing protein [Minwuia thermotolerans]|nr:DUF4864 domain-containing protein [Minwuia thermotolerans]
MCIRLHALVLALCLAWPALAAPADEIRAVIEDQIAAFRAGDGDRAFAHASPAIQAKFGSPANFMEMVRTGYPQVYRPRDMQFQAVEAFEHVTVQEVFFFGQDGSAVVARYFMEMNEAGAWKIAGVELRQAPELGV